MESLLNLVSGQKISLISLTHSLAKSIYLGSKRYELRKTRPSIAIGDIMVIYETLPAGVISGAFRVSRVFSGVPHELFNEIEASGFSHKSFQKYFLRCSFGYAFEIGETYKFDHPISLQEARMLDNCFRPPQSYFYFLSNSRLGMEITNRIQ